MFFPLVIGMAFTKEKDPKSAGLDIKEKRTKVIDFIKEEINVVNKKMVDVKKEKKEDKNQEDILIEEPLKKEVRHSM